MFVAAFLKNDLRKFRNLNEKNYIGASNNYDDECGSAKPCSLLTCFRTPGKMTKNAT